MKINEDKKNLNIHSPFLGGKTTKFTTFASFYMQYQTLRLQISFHLDVYMCLKGHILNNLTLSLSYKDKWKTIELSPLCKIEYLNLAKCVCIFWGEVN